MSQITMRPPHAGMKVSMLGSDYAYARQPLGATQYWEDLDPESPGYGKKYDAQGNEVDNTGKIINAVGTGLNIIEDIINFFKPKPVAPVQSAPVKDNTTLYVVGGAAALIVLVMVLKK